jgi:hypothetical protein
LCSWLNFFEDFYMAKTKNNTNWLQTISIRLSRVHFVYIAVYMASIIVFDSWNLFTHPAIGDRWTAAAILLILNTVCWYVSRIKFNSDTIYIFLVILLVIADIIFAATNVYWERGLASKAVALFAIPIITAAALRSRSTILAAASLSTAAYSLTVIRYYNLHYGESLRIELYGYVGLFCAVFFILAALLMIIIQPNNDA